jgi:hypothetical protein
MTTICISQYLRQHFVLSYHYDLILIITSTYHELGNHSQIGKEKVKTATNCFGIKEAEESHMEAII